GNKFFTGSTFAADQNRGVCLGNFRDKLIHSAHPGTFTDHVVFNTDVGLKPAVFSFEPFHVLRILDGDAGHAGNTHHQLKVTFVEQAPSPLRLEVDHTGHLVE